jgi:menaquinone-dependent protoporphyrinogen oxidase
MKTAIFFATREGQTQKIATHIADVLRANGLSVDVLDVKALSAPIEWSKYSTAWVAASVHTGHHEREMIEFVKRHRRELQRVGAVFVSVTLSQAGAEDVQAPAERRQQAARDARRMIDAFIAETGWKPVRSLPVAGALAYTRYNWLVRRIMVHIARQQGASTDTSMDHEFTNWPALDRFVNDVVTVTRISRV